MNPTIPSPTLAEIGQIAITVADVAKATAFYRDVLGLKFLFKTGPNLAFLAAVKIEYAWLMMFHDIGRLIHEHLLRRQDRAGYAAKTFSQLASDTGVSKRVLYEWVQFFRYFPIVRQSAQLTRTHYRLLCQVGDEKQRKTLTVQATKNRWNSTDLGKRVRALNAARSAASESNDGSGIIDLKPTPALLTPKRGRPGVYRVVARDDALFPITRWTKSSASAASIAPRWTLPRARRPSALSRPS